MQKQCRRQEEQKGQSGEKDSHGGFCHGNKSPDGAQNKEKRPGDE